MVTALPVSPDSAPGVAPGRHRRPPPHPPPAREPADSGRSRRPGWYCARAWSSAYSRSRAIYRTRRACSCAASPTVELAPVDANGSGLPRSDRVGRSERAYRFAFGVRLWGRTAINGTFTVEPRTRESLVILGVPEATARSKVMAALRTCQVRRSPNPAVAWLRLDAAMTRGWVGCTRSRPKPPWPPWTTERRWSAHPGWRRTSRGRPGPEPDRRHVDDHLQEPGALGPGLDSAPRRDEAASHLLIARRGPGDVHPAGARPRRVGEPAVIRHTQEADDAEADDGGSGGGIAGGLP